MTDLLDSLINVLSKSELVKEIPIIGTIVKLAKASMGCRDYLFIKKIQRFIDEFGNTTSKERQKLISKFREDKEKERIGSTLMILLDKADDLQKADLLAVIFSEYLQGKFDREQLFSAFGIL